MVKETSTPDSVLVQVLVVSVEIAGFKKAVRSEIELHVAEQECYEAATLPSRPYGELLPSGEQRLSFARRVPAGVRLA